jgi:hypothetical protein
MFLSSLTGTALELVKRNPALKRWAIVGDFLFATNWQDDVLRRPMGFYSRNPMRMP